MCCLTDYHMIQWLQIIIKIYFVWESEVWPRLSRDSMSLFYVLRAGADLLGAGGTPSKMAYSHGWRVWLLSQALGQDLNFFPYGPPTGCLGFLSAWQLGSKNEVLGDRKKWKLPVVKDWTQNMAQHLFGLIIYQSSCHEAQIVGKFPLQGSFPRPHFLVGGMSKDFESRF